MLSDSLMQGVRWPVVSCGITRSFVKSREVLNVLALLLLWSSYANTETIVLNCLDEHEEGKDMKLEWSLRATEKHSKDIFFSG